MKKNSILVVIVMMASIIFVSSCSKKTDTGPDLTTDIVGIYKATVVDSTAGVTGYVSKLNEGLQVVKVDNNHVRFTRYNGGIFIECTAQLENITGSVTNFTIPSFTISGKTYAGITATTGTFVKGVDVLSYTIKSTAGDTEQIGAFKQ